MKPSTRIFLAIFGAGGLIFSLPCMLSMSTYVIGTGIGFKFYFIVPLIISIAMLMLATSSAYAIFTAMKSPPPPLTQTEEGIERLILQVARAHNGRISPTHVASATPLSIEQVTNALLQLEQVGRIYSVLTINDGTEFVFPDLLPPTTELEQFNDEFEEQNHVLDLASSQHEHHTSQHPQPAYRTTDQP